MRGRIRLSIANRFRAPGPDVLTATTPIGTPDGGDGSGSGEPEPVTGQYARIQTILESAAGNTSPLHGGLQRFWLRPYAEFVGLSVYGHKLIADADRMLFLHPVFPHELVGLSPEEIAAKVPSVAELVL